MLAAYGAASAFVYGFLLNLSFWPFTLGADTRLSFVPGAPVLENLHRYLAVRRDDLARLGHRPRDHQRVLLLLAGAPVLAALRRAARGPFDAPVTFLPHQDDATAMKVPAPWERRVPSACRESR